LSPPNEHSTQARFINIIGPTACIFNDIFEMIESERGGAALDAASPDVVVGGFPCQDYSVAQPLSQSKGLEGKRDILWWAIAALLRQRIERQQPVKYLILENVDRLIKSLGPVRGRDFAAVLSTLYGLGYAVEWRVVNAADYGFAQRRRRVFIVAYHARLLSTGD
jgi:DNA (cytosine-5)-methyltransferase 1